LIGQLITRLPACMRTIMPMVSLLVMAGLGIRVGAAPGSEAAEGLPVLQFPFQSTHKEQLLTFQDGTHEDFQDAPKAASKSQHAVQTQLQDDFGLAEVDTAELAESWGYGSSGLWGGSCQGADQSPIDIKSSSAQVAGDDRYVNLNYMQGKGMGLENDGHTIVGSGDALNFHKMTLNGTDYWLKRFVFHRPSEHTVDGRRFSLEVQLQHEASNKDKVSLSILFNEGAENAFLNRLNWKHLPKKKGAGNGVSSDIQMNDLIPGYNANNFFRFYMYTGSSTTPPCDANVRWVVAKQQAEISTDQLSKFPYNHNSRPVQALGDRAIYENAAFTNWPSVAPTTGNPTRTPTKKPTTPPTRSPTPPPTTAKPTLPPTQSPTTLPPTRTPTRPPYVIRDSEDQWMSNPDPETQADPDAFSAAPTIA